MRQLSGKNFRRRFIEGPSAFFVFLFLIYSAVSMLNVFIPLYYRDGVGLAKPQIGLLGAVIPVCAVIISPVWGALADRAKYKNSVMYALLGGLTVAALVFPLGRTFIYAAFATFLFGVFYSFLQSLSDAMIAETSNEKGWDYGRIRLGGTFGYAVMCIVSGSIANFTARVNSIFFLLSAIMAVSLIYSFSLPKVEGHARARSRAGYSGLLKNRSFILIIAFCFCYYLCLGYYYSFYTINLTSPQIGGTSWMAGLSVAMSALCEIFFLSNARKVIRKIGTHNTLLTAAAVACVRFVIIGLSTSPWPIIAANLLHGYGHVVTLYCVTIYIADNIEPELTASAQAVFTVVFLGVTRIIGSVAGGFLAEAWGTGAVFLLVGGLCAATVAVFLFVFKFSGGTERNE